MKEDRAKAPQRALQDLEFQQHGLSRLGALHLVNVAFMAKISPTSAAERALMTESSSFAWPNSAQVMASSNDDFPAHLARQCMPGRRR
jgi:hypothetical protein